MTDTPADRRLKLEFRALLTGKFSIREVRIAKNGEVVVLIHDPTQSDVTGVVNRVLGKSELAYWHTGHGRNEDYGYFLGFKPK